MNQKQSPGNNIDEKEIIDTEQKAIQQLKTYHKQQYLLYKTISENLKTHNNIEVESFDDISVTSISSVQSFDTEKENPKVAPCRFLTEPDLYLLELEEEVNRLNLQVARERSRKEELQTRLNHLQRKQFTREELTAGKEKARAWAADYFKPNPSKYKCTPANLKEAQRKKG